MEFFLEFKQKGHKNAKNLGFDEWLSSICFIR